MGGGDLNSKKSWHPNTMKNQERVWKAEQAVAEEKKRMIELQRERAEERDRDELNSIMNKNNSGSDHRLSWMYDKPDKKVEQEEYLLGRALNKSADQPQDVVQDPIPAVSRRVVGSSMLTTGGDVQVDITRKIREDPLILIKERERAARAALLNNPLQRRKLTELLRQEQNKKKDKKKKPKKKDKDLDDLLAAKLNALGGEKGLDLATLLDSDDSLSEEVEKTKSKKKRKKHKSEKKKKHKHQSDSESDTSLHKSSHDRDSHKSSKKDKHILEHQTDKYSEKESRAHHSRKDSAASKEYRDRYDNKRYDDEASKKYVPNKSTYDRDRTESYKSSSKRLSPEDGRNKRDLDNRSYKKHRGLSDAEKAARLAEMAAAGVEREVERGRRVVAQRSADEAATTVSRVGPSRNEARALPESLEERIRSNRHYIQRDKRHMNENFARR